MEGTVPSFTIVTLGVSDLDRSVAFYAALGWEQRGDRAQDIVWFRTSGTWLGLFGYDALAEDAGLLAVPAEQLPDYRGVSLALNFNDEAAVDAAMRSAVAAGARLVKAADRAPWGGWSGYVADPDGHLWEMAYAPGLPVDEHGRIEID